MNFVKYIPTPTYKQVTDKTRINISLYYYVKNEINRVFANAIASHEKDWRCLEFNNFIGDFLIGEIKYWEDYYAPEDLVGQDIYYFKEENNIREARIAIKYDEKTWTPIEFSDTETTKTAIERIYEERKSVLNDKCTDVLIYSKLMEEFAAILSYMRSNCLIATGFDPENHDKYFSDQSCGIFGIKYYAYVEYRPLQQIWACSLFPNGYVKMNDKNDSHD